ncbi:MAG: hypothetical protein AAFY76_06505 [Cyanobacteria bacterium J06649_11]
MEILDDHDYHQELSFESAQRVSRFTVQMFRISDKGTIESFASGVLFQFEENYFLITASHVFENEHVPELRIRSGDGVIEIHGEFLRVLNDILDIAIVKLSNSSALNLKESHSFLGLVDIEFNPVQKILRTPTPDLSNYYMMFGYPASKTKAKYNSPKEINIVAYYVGTYLHRDNVNRLKEEGYKWHLFTDRRKKYIGLRSRNKQHAPSLNGMSGSGLWEIKVIDIQSKEPTTKLAGIFIEKNGEHLVSIKAEIAIPIIRERWKLYRLPNITIDFDGQKVVR